MAAMLRVGIADYKVSKAPDTIISYGLGSCVGISLYDPQTKVGGLLHILLPDSTQARAQEKAAKFADTGIPLLVKDVLAQGASKGRLIAKIAGGAQMFAFANASELMKVGTRNVEAVKAALKKEGIRITGEDTGANYGRTVQIDLETGVYTVKAIGKPEKQI